MYITEGYMNKNYTLEKHLKFLSETDGVTVGRTSRQKNGCASMVWTSKTVES